MAKVQTRRSVSMQREVYDQLRSWCEAHDQSMSHLVERLLLDFFATGSAVVPDVPRPAPKPIPISVTENMPVPCAAPAPSSNRAGNIFTF